MRPMGLLLATVFAGSVLALPEAGLAQCFDVAVTVAQTKPNGRPWDTEGGAYAPDIEIKLEERTFPLCKDAFSCQAPGFRASSRMVGVTVTDKDAQNDDVIGNGVCALNRGDCQVGQAYLRATPCR